ncbi:MAG: division/cell wall cluster transcriptional repressor MraZ [Chloroflexi bacterium]|nr:division/cell wall cluster transcriptional repressor MraZ [Chloroflexota bacterium]
MFLGQFEHTIDSKGRLAIPSRFRAELDGGLYLTAGVDRCLHILTPAAWDQMATGISQLPWLHPNVRQVQRNVFAMATHLEPDRIGRIVLPLYLRAYAGLQTDVVIAGVFDRVEIWDRDNWYRLRGEFESSGSEQVQSVMDLLRRPPEHG